MPRRQLSGSRMILTGASSGIGRSLALRLARRGARLLITARRIDRLESVQREIESGGGLCQIVAGDLTSDSVRQTIVAACEQHFGGLDCLINNAGIGAMGKFETASSERLRQIFEVNFFAMAELVRLALPVLKRGDDPLIVNVSSVLGHRAVPLKSEYCASKFAIHGFSDALRAELADIPIEVLLISPSTVDSEFFDSALEDTTGKKWKGSQALKPDYVARRIVDAMARRRHEILLPASGWALVWFDRLLPGIANRAIARFQK